MWNASPRGVDPRGRAGGVLRTALSTTLVAAALLGLPAAASVDGLDAVGSLEETADTVVHELP